MATERTFELVVFGATGFTGRLTADYLASRVTGPWAIAGRDRGKLEQVAAELGAQGRRPEVRVADSRDPAALSALTAETRVVATTVGPFDEVGDALVASCVASGTDYLDITGEPAFVRRQVQKHDAAARAAGLRIVHCCGFDSVPHDFGAWLTVQQLPSDQPLRVEGFVEASGQISGGTWHSAIGAMARPRGAVAATPRQAGDGRRVRDLAPWPRYEKRLGTWVAPLPTIDPWIVLRSAAALQTYGPDFAYGHHLCVSSLPQLLGGLGSVAGMVALAQFGPTRNWLLGKIPRGKGPNAERRARAHFKVYFFGEAPTGEKAHVVVAGGDPGYGETSKMLAEAALTLLDDRHQLPPGVGVQTPVVTLGQPYLNRLRAAGLHFDVLS